MRPHSSAKPGTRVPGFFVGAAREWRARAAAAAFGFAAVVVVTGCSTAPAAPASGRAKPPAEKPVAGAPAGSKMPANDAQAILAHHNKVRSEVGVGPLKWSPSLAAYAQQWADHLAATTCRMRHRRDGKYGENLYQGTAGFYTAVDAARAWEREKKDYRGGPVTRSNTAKVGHYTQMVWRETASVGCGQAVCRKLLIVSCNYDPPGNYIGRNPY
jgi:pathogenesis-related protein 1